MGSGVVDSVVVLGGFFLFCFLHVGVFLSIFIFFKVLLCLTFTSLSFTRLWFTS